MSNKGTQFKKGKDAREKGRAGGIASGESRRRYKDVMQYTRDVLEIPKDENPDSKAPGEFVILRMLKEAVEKGDVRAASFLFDRAYGKVPQAIDVNAKGTHSVNVRFCKTDEEVEKWK